MSLIICEYCERVFKSNSSLNHHKKRAKYCLELQSKYPLKFQCEFCDKVLATNFGLQRHFEICKGKKMYTNAQLIECYETRLRQQKDHYEQQEKMYLKQIQDLQDRLENLARAGIEKSTITTNNTTTTTHNYINMRPFTELTPEYVANQVDEHFTLKYFTQGQKGLARFAYNKLLKDSDGNLYMECSDPSRHVFRIKDSYGSIIRDLKAKRLTSIIAEPVKLKSDQILREIEEDTPWMLDQSRDIALEIQGLSKDNSDMCKELAILVSGKVGD
jgi:hypothetical protein